ncbi:MAG: hypothetical protein KDK26_07815 [Roseivivax sp.]|nr:hypothetical protein [Roseivivax sp.]
MILEIAQRSAADRRLPHGKAPRCREVLAAFEAMGEKRRGRLPPTGKYRRAVRLAPDWRVKVWRCTGIGGGPSGKDGPRL